MGKSSAPPAPDYTAAANATAAGNLAAAQTTAAANRVNQVTPYGNLMYSSAGNDSSGNPTYTATQTLSPAQQGILDQQNQLNTGLMTTANKGLNYANDVLSHSRKSSHATKAVTASLFERVLPPFIFR